ncbi:serine hydrolase domain-containing protein [Neobacillus massiliamazoniensis]|uniref:serine hydrolase domain-containing protein n=1 Tax=Neobacillus massiliamazoniensis TaxID=1499688 RepID=UPI00159EE112|nr:serine hydrolase [Neobacillus massiliamazoniensis]
MKIKTILCFLIFAIFVETQNNFPNYIETKKAAQKMALNEPTQKKLRQYLLSKHVNGSVAVIRETQILFNEGIGFADIKKGRANLPSTTFPIGSITKAIVATSIMQLQEDGRLSIQDPVSKYIPHFPPGKKIKLIHLLNQTSGIPSPRWYRGDFKPADIINRLKEKPVKFSAGSKWDYNDINYFILSYIVETVSGTTLHDYIQKNIFNRASMVHSGFMTHKNPIPYSSKGYIRLGNKVIQAKPNHIDQLFGCGDIYSTAYDLYLFDEAMVSGKLVSMQSLQTMLTPSNKSKYGAGLYIDGEKVYSRGVLSGWESLHVFYPDQTAIVILLNIHDKNFNIHQAAKDIYKMIDTKGENVSYKAN